jgi:hypothetical protein
MSVNYTCLIVEMSLFFAPKCMMTAIPVFTRRFIVAKCFDVWKLGAFHFMLSAMVGSAARILRVVVQSDSFNH